MSTAESSQSTVSGEMVPRDYQTTCVNSVRDAYKSGVKKVMVVMPTGTGKTVLFAEIIRKWRHEVGGRVLVLAHREELVFQAQKKIAWALEHANHEPMSVAIEMGEMKALEPKTMGLFSLDEQVKCVVASIQSLHKKRLERFKPEKFGLVIVDECHHCVRKNGSYASILRHFAQNEKILVLGVTATPDRADEEALGGIFELVAFSYQITDAIDDGWLVPIRQEMVFIDSLDFSKVSLSSGDLSAVQLDDILSAEEMCHKVVVPTLKLVGEKKTLVFASGVAQAQKMAEIFNRHKPGSAHCIVGSTDPEERRSLLKAYSAGHFQFLTGCGVFIEGYDEPTIEVIVQARPTRSRSMYSQICGRGTRILPNVIEGTTDDGRPWRLETPAERKVAIAMSNKPELMVIDFVGNAGKHKLIYAADMLGGNFSEEAVAAVTQAIKKRGKSQDVVAELKAARKTIEEERRKRLAGLIVDAKFSTKSVDPFDVLDVSTKTEPGWFKSKQPTDGQLNLLRNKKVDFYYDEGRWWFGKDADRRKPGIARKQMTFWSAKLIIDEIVRRRKENLCTYSQAQTLKRFGERADVSFDEARKLIDRIAANGWRPIVDQSFE